MIGNSEAVNAPKKKKSACFQAKKAAEEQTEQLVFTHVYEIS
jgi:hypothetical protein